MVHLVLNMGEFGNLSSELITQIMKYNVRASTIGMPKANPNHNEEQTGLRVCQGHHKSFSDHTGLEADANFSTRFCSAWLKSKLNTKIGLHTHHPPQTFLPEGIVIGFRNFTWAPD